MRDQDHQRFTYKLVFWAFIGAAITIAITIIFNL